MAITALPTPPSRQDPTNFAVQADAFLGQLPTFAVEANSLQQDVNTKQTATASSATAAAASATAANTSASAAAASASAANTSATNAAANAATVAANTTTVAANTATVAANTTAVAANAAAVAIDTAAAAASASAANTSASAANTSATAANTSATAAASSATAAAASASAANTSATAAASSAAAAETDASSAFDSANAALDTFSSFDTRYLGSKSSAPTVDNNGNALLVGAVYWNSTSNTLFIWTGSIWNTAAATITSGVNTFNSRFGNVNLTSADVTGVLDSTVDFTAGIISASDFNSTSDVSLKTDITAIDPKLLQAIRPVSFNWKDTGEKSYGVIAQELQQVLPELVQTRQDGLLGVSYIPIIALLVQAVQELQATVNKLQQK